MSLLLEALKKAELAKQDARSGVDHAAARTEPQPSPESATPIMTRERLPDITQPLEILTDDLPSAGAKAAAAREPARPALTPETLAAMAPAPEAAPAPDDAALAGQRQQARQLFEVKAMDYNPKRPFYITLGALALAATGYGVYLWWQLQPKANVNLQTLQEAQSRAESASAPAAPPIGAAPAQAASTAPAPAPPQVLPPPMPAAPTQAAASSAAVPMAAAPPRPAPRPVPQAAAPTAPAPAESRPTFVRREAATIAAATRPAQRAQRAPIAVNPPALVSDAALDHAYEAFQRNELASAQEGYQRVLAREPANRDALLGLAAIDLRRRNYEAAEARYLKLLEIDPRDSHAIAGLIALRGQVDPVLSESRLKILIASQPEATHLYFTLGNQYALQSRWTEAQAAYFKAYSADPENADYAFNLAISLDQLRQKQAALDYYRRSLALADRRPNSFDRLQVEARIRELSR